ncbi:MAG: DUF554 domain-containing protein [Bacteroidales bacterium]|nr:DUF554 domain-containing protein [Bacteroidales bacterium]
MVGTLINAGAVTVGSIIGLLIGKRVPGKLANALFHAIGLFTMVIGLSMALKTNNFLIMVFSLILGTISGELLKLEEGIEKLGEKVKKGIRSDHSKFSEGLMTAFLLYCMGSMTVLGAFEEGLGEKPTLLFTKSLLDGFAAIALASSFGIGVIFAAIPLLIYQASLTLFAKYLGSFLTEQIIIEMTAVGGVMLLGLGISILEIKKIKVINLIPALVFAVLLALLFQKLN